MCHGVSRQRFCRLKICCEQPLEFHSDPNFYATEDSGAGDNAAPAGAGEQAPAGCPSGQALAASPEPSPAPDPVTATFP